jgi:hypothetical protein
MCRSERAKYGSANKVAMNSLGQRKSDFIRLPQWIGQFFTADDRCGGNALVPGQGSKRTQMI